MFQADANLPERPLKPSPWALRGQGWIVALRLPKSSPARHAFLPPELAGQCRSHFAIMMFVDYAESDAGPYHELLFIPGSLPFRDGKRHLSISRILVSTWDSVVNGRRNWGIPKDRADFAVRYNVDGSGIDHIVVRDGERVMADMKLRATWPFTLPMLGTLVPASLRTLAQRYNGADYFYAPSASGSLCPGRMESWHFDEALFPDLSGSHIIAAMKIPEFRMTFPIAHIIR